MPTMTTIYDRHVNLQIQIVSPTYLCKNYKDESQPTMIIVQKEHEETGNPQQETT